MSLTGHADSNFLLPYETGTIQVFQHPLVGMSLVHPHGILRLQLFRCLHQFQHLQQLQFLHSSLFFPFKTLPHHYLLPELLYHNLRIRLASIPLRLLSLFHSLCFRLELLLACQIKLQQFLHQDFRHLCLLSHQILERLQLHMLIPPLMW